MEERAPKRKSTASSVRASAPEFEAGADDPTTDVVVFKKPKKSPKSNKSKKARLEVKEVESETIHIQEEVKTKEIKEEDNYSGDITEEEDYYDGGDDDEKKKQWLSVYSQTPVTELESYVNAFATAITDPDIDLPQVIKDMIHGDIERYRSTDPKIHRPLSFFMFFNMFDLPSKIKYAVDKFSSPFGECIRVKPRFPLLQKNDDLKLRLPPVPISWFKGAPLGNYHPQEDDDHGTNNMNKARYGADFSLSPVPMYPELSPILKSLRDWIVRVDQMMAERVWEDGACFPSVKNKINSKYKNLSQQEKREIFLDPNAGYRRSAFKNPEKTNGDPYVISAHAKAMRVCTEKEALQFETKPYKAPGGLQVILDHHNKCRPKKKEGKTQKYWVSQNLHLFDGDGKFIRMEDRREIKCYDEKGEFIPPYKRTTFPDGTMVIPYIGLEYTEFKGDNPTYGPSWILHEDGIQMWKNTCLKTTREEPILDDKDVEEDLLPRMFPVSGGEKLSFLTSDPTLLSDDALLEAPIPMKSQQ